MPTYDARTINITHITSVTNVTNVTNVSQVVPGSVYAHQRVLAKGRRHPGAERQEQRPKLLRYCQTCGMIDGDTVAGMSSGEVCRESAKVVAFASKNIASVVSEACRGVWGGICDIVDSFRE